MSRRARASARVKGFEYDSLCVVCDLADELSWVTAGALLVFLVWESINSVVSFASCLGGFAASVSVLFFGG